MKTGKKLIQEFVQKESSSGILLMITTVLALLFSNSFLAPAYQSFLHIPLEIGVGDFRLDKSLYHWVNDGLMVLFFFLIGLEVKRETLEGHLSSIRQAILPCVAAVGGMLVPALVYVFFNIGDASAMRGWAIPAATDIAFALGILSLLGKRVPLSLKVFLLALAIIDDLGAIVIIALFYTKELSMTPMAVALVSLAGLIALNRFGVAKRVPYYLLGVVLWVSVLKSGVHATLAGVALAFTIPLRAHDENGQEISPLKDIEHGLHPWVAFFILPLFAFVNAGVNIGAISLQEMLSPVPLGIMLGLFLGKQIGVFGFSLVAIKLGVTTLPQDSNWRQLYGVSVLTGIGFTMSLFIASLAFAGDNSHLGTDKLAVLIGSLFSGVLGYLVLRHTCKSCAQ